ncbi:TIGR02117 family protein [Stagnihabitans tardus]|uniref:TIGR02117 family protein n=1 Tax=Stagnihabitans tardus TaxID=2699202 RepID=A0AAE4YAC4_9RHOB|nr:TIGR02117 family protein [Stagnihabitans tardus]NBZ86639.1 TIGR02117 family protein [Stagnihabitans tardus]
MRSAERGRKTAWPLRWLRGLALGISALALALLAGAMWPGAVTPRSDGGADTRIGLIAGPIHTDFLLPLTPALRRDFGFLAAEGMALDHPQARYLVLGWGAREFYTSAGRYQDIRAGAVWRAVTGDDAVVHVDLAGEVAADRWIAVSEAQLAALSRSIRGQMAAEPLPGAGFHGGDLFFPAEGRFSLWRTCNAWVGEELRRAGVDFGAWTPLPQSVALSAWWFHGRQVARGAASGLRP